MVSAMRLLSIPAGLLAIPAGLLAIPAGLLALSVLFIATTWAGEQQVTIHGSDYPTPGILTLPTERRNRLPGVLLLHGTASQKNEVGNLYARLARALEDSGIASLRIDFAGTGDSPVSYRNYSLSSATADALHALDYLRARPDVDSESIIVVGFSQGGLIAQRVALAAGDIAGLLTWSTVAVDGVGSFQDFFDAHYAAALSDGFAEVSFAWLSEPLSFDLRWFQEIREQKTLTAMRDFEKPILAIAGAKDQTVPNIQSLALVAQSTHPRSRALILANANHIFNVLDEVPETDQPSSGQQLLAESVGWISGILQPAIGK
jgi:pimeloyl-ACP methyl ester carboxylesterase